MTIQGSGESLCSIPHTDRGPACRGLRAWRSGRFQKMRRLLCRQRNVLLAYDVHETLGVLTCQTRAIQFNSIIFISSSREKQADPAEPESS